MTQGSPYLFWPRSKDFVDDGRDIASFENVIRIMEIIGRRPVASIWGGRIDNIESLSEIHGGIQKPQKGLIVCFDAA